MGSKYWCEIDTELSINTIQEIKNWDLSTWKIFRTIFWKTYYQERDKATNETLSSKNESYRRRFRFKKLNKIRQFNANL